MKTYLPYSLILAAAASGMAFGAETAYTTPVGYATTSLPVGTTYVGVTLQPSTVAAGLVGTITSTQMTSTVNFGAAMPGGAAVTYVVEFLNASGVIQEVTGASASGTTLNLPENVTSFVAAGDKFAIRPASTVASVFGATNSAGLEVGFGGPTGADLVQIPNAVGGLDQYYFDGDDSAWFKVASPTPILIGNGSTIPIIYPDAILVVIQAIGKSLVTSGEVKTTQTNHAISAGTNYLGSIYPVGATLKTAFGNASALASIDPGFGGPTGADLVQIVESGVFSQYYYDGDDTVWFKVASPTNINVGDGSTVPLPSGFIFANQNGAFNLLNTPPANYSSL
jgi:hypothetical protein